MDKINIRVTSSGIVAITVNGFSVDLARTSELADVTIEDDRTLTETAQYQIGWHDGYRAKFNEENNANYLEKDKRMVASLKPEQKDSIGG
jgi:hypothetical protein